MKNITFKKTALLSFVLMMTLLIGSYFWADYETTDLNPAVRSQLGIKSVELKYGATHYELIGNDTADTVVLVHGFSTPNTIWDKNVNSLLAAGFRVLRFDLYGRGFSDRPELNYTLDVFVEQLKELSETLKIKKPFHLVGISMGGCHKCKV